MKDQTCGLKDEKKNAQVTHLELKTWQTPLQAFSLKTSVLNLTQRNVKPKDL